MAAGKLPRKEKLSLLSTRGSITLNDLDLPARPGENRQLLIRGKGEKQRAVPLTEQAVEAIKAYLPHRVKTEDRHLFVSAYGGHPIQPSQPRLLWRSRLAGRVVNAILKIVIRNAHLEGQGITPHKLRHTLGRSPHGRAFATFTRLWRASLIRNGVDICTVQELLGDSKLETTAKYLHSDTRTKQAAVEKLDGLLGSATKTEENDD